MPRAEFEPAIPASELTQTDALDRAAGGSAQTEYRVFTKEWCGSKS